MFVKSRAAFIKGVSYIKLFIRSIRSIILLKRL